MSSTPVVTRFAPSPTGYLHIGGARTALFSWLYARANGGKFLLRIEDTDIARSTHEATQAILDSLTWLGLNWDDEPISQAKQAPRHRAVADEMLASGNAYKCFSTREEIDAFRDEARAKGSGTLFQSPWRDVPDAEHPELPFVVRIKAPKDGYSVIKDRVQGKVTWKNDTLDDMVLLRSDGTPTYMLAVVVDDHDMGVTHIIRGDDHLSNAARQSFIYQAMGWDVPEFAHVPLIHGEDGKKLSKRHGALGLGEYRDMGYPAAAVRNYLARLGWSHGNDEFFSTEQAIEWFGFDGMGKAPARLDFKKLGNISGQHISAMPNDELLTEINDFLSATGQDALTQSQQEALLSAMTAIKERAKTLPELIEKAHFVLSNRPFKPNASAGEILNPVSRSILNRLTAKLRAASWDKESLEAVARDFADEEELKLGMIAQPLRAALTGRTVSPSVFDVMVIIGKDESIARLEDAAV